MGEIFRANRHTLISVGIILVILLAGLQNLIEYLRPDLNVILCLMMAPWVFDVKKPGEYSWRYAFLAVTSLILYHILHMQFLFLMGVGSLIILVIESRHGKLGMLPLITLVLLSPMLQFLVRIFTFPVRLKLSSLSASILRNMGMEVTVSGNVFETGGISFAVDQACLGLNTMIAGLIITTMLLAFTEKRIKASTRLAPLVFIYGLTIGLLLISNLSRIILIVIFKSMPDSLSHDLIGLACLIVYVGIPVYLLIGLLEKRFPGFFSYQPGYRPTNPPYGLPVRQLILYPALTFLVLLLNINREAYRSSAPNPEITGIDIPGMSREVLESGIVRFQDDNLLLYIKPPTGIWRADHNPTVCWRASGYEIHHIREIELEGITIYEADLINDGHTLHTAWWYDNGRQQTVSQLVWRWKTLEGADDFSLINITSGDRNLLIESCRNLLRENAYLPEKVSTSSL